MDRIMAVLSLVALIAGTLGLVWMMRRPVRGQFSEVLNLRVTPGHSDGLGNFYMVHWDESGRHFRAIVPLDGCEEPGPFVPVPRTPRPVSAP